MRGFVLADRIKDMLIDLERCKEHLVKPVNAQQLADAIDRVLRTTSDSGAR